jgi:hypothetical protein
MVSALSGEATYIGENWVCRCHASSDGERFELVPRVDIIHDLSQNLPLENTVGTHVCQSRNQAPDQECTGEPCRKHNGEQQNRKG